MHLVDARLVVVKALGKRCDGEFFELYNPTMANYQLGNCFVEGSTDVGFPVEDGDVLFLYSADRATLIDAEVLPAPGSRPGWIGCPSLLVRAG